MRGRCEKRSAPTSRITGQRRAAYSRRRSGVADCPRPLSGGRSGRSVRRTGRAARPAPRGPPELLDGWERFWVQVQTDMANRALLASTDRSSKTPTCCRDTGLRDLATPAPSKENGGGEQADRPHASERAALCWPGIAAGTAGPPGHARDRAPPRYPRLAGRSAWLAPMPAAKCSPSAGTPTVSGRRRCSDDRGMQEESSRG